MKKFEVLVASGMQLADDMNHMNIAKSMVVGS